MLSKAEAAAVYTARTMLATFKEDEILPVCDVGGGTTDLSAFRVKNNTLEGSPHLEKIDVLSGATISATQLDAIFEKATLERLQDADRLQSTDIRDLSQAA